MDDKIFLTLLLYKDIISEKDSSMKHLHYRVLGPMMGTIENDIFTNTSDRIYCSIEKSSTNMDDQIRYAYYSLLSLKEAKSKYQTDSVEEVVSSFFKEHEKDTYYVISKAEVEPLIIKYDEEKMKRKMNTDIVMPL